METLTDYDKTKRVCIAFGIFLFVSLLVTLLDFILWNPEPTVIFKIFVILLQVILMASALYIGYWPNIKSGVITKIGAILLFISFTYGIITLFYSPIFHDTTSQVIYICFYTAFDTTSLMLFVWGMHIWMPVKIVMSFLIIPRIAYLVAFSDWIHFLEDYDSYVSDIYIANFEKAVNIINISSIIIISISLLLITIRLITNKRPMQSETLNANALISHQQTLQTPKAKTPKIITKIPNKMQ